MLVKEFTDSSLPHISFEDKSSNKYYKLETISMSDIGVKIKELRIIKSFSQQDLAEMLGIKQNTVSQYENNVKRPSYEILVQLADIFDVSTDYLLGREEF